LRVTAPGAARSRTRSVVFAKLQLPSIVGLILTGALFGPTGLGLIADVEQVEVYAEIGVRRHHNDPPSS
jgi:Kef-type K+ transport system membrane component KefB